MRWNCFVGCLRLHEPCPFVLVLVPRRRARSVSGFQGPDYEDEDDDEDEPGARREGPSTARTHRSFSPLLRGEGLG